MIRRTFDQLYTIYLGVFAFNFCVFPKLIPLLIVGLGVFTIIGFQKKQFEWKWNLPAIALSLFYFAYLIGIYFTNNSDLAKMYAENKLSFIVFPLILSFRTKFYFSLRYPIIGLVLGIVVASYIGLINGVLCYIEQPSFELCFTSSYITPLHHPTYFSIFILIAGSGIWFGYYEKWKYFNLKIVLSLTFFFLVMYFASKSLAGIIFLFLALSLLFYRWLYLKVNRILSAVLFLLLPFVFGLLISVYPSINTEFQETKDHFSKFLNNSNQFLIDKKGKYLTGNEVRMIMWRVTADKIKENPFGVGTGNIDDHLSETLIRNGFEELAIKEYNPHNQYLQTTLEIGFQGLIILLLIFISALIFAVKNKNWILLILVSAFMFNSFFESMFQRESGIVFFSFWMCILLVYSNSKKIKPVILE